MKASEILAATESFSSRKDKEKFTDLGNKIIKDLQAYGAMAKKAGFDKEYKKEFADFKKSSVACADAASELNFLSGNME